MATTGVIAKVYQCPYIQAITIAAVDSNPDTYTDSGNGFLKAGFADGDSVTVSGFSTGGNNGVKTIVSVTAGTITLGTALTGELAGDVVTIVKNVPGTLVGSCGGWSVEESCEPIDITTFGNTISPSLTGTTFTFVDGGAGLVDTITDSLNGFIDAGFCIGDHVKVTGSTASDGTYVVSDVAAGVLTVPTASFSDEAAGDAVTITANSITATSIAFVDGAGNADTITDSNSGFVSAGFQDGDEISISGSTFNNIGCVVSDAAAGVLTVPTGTLTAEDAGDTVTIKKVSRWKVFKAGQKSWTATITKFWDATGQGLFNVPRRYEFFQQYYATPSGTDIAYYLEGIGIANAINVPLNVLEVCKQPITITGSGALTHTTKAEAW
jgi:hypothetical protein